MMSDLGFVLAGLLAKKEIFKRPSPPLLGLLTRLSKHPAKNISSINCWQYWQYFALDVGTYEVQDINAGGGKGEEIKAEIQQDYAK